MPELEESTKKVVRRLAVFDGGWTLDAAAHVCGSADPLRSLMEKALVEADAAGARFRMPEPVRAEALREAESSEEVTDARDRHLDYFVQLAAAAKPELLGPRQASWLTRLDAERANILAAHDWAGRVERHGRTGLKLVNSIKLYWMNRGLLPLGLAVTMEALLRPAAQARTPERAQGLFNAGQLRYFMGRYRDARRCLEASLDMARELSQAHVSAVLQPLGMAALGEGDYALARRCFDEATQMSQAAGDTHSLAGALNCQAMLHRVQGEFARARPLYEQVVRLSDEHDHHEAKATGLLNLAMVCTDMGFIEEGRNTLEEAIEIASRLQSVPAAQSALDVAAAFACLAGDWMTAVRFVAASDAQSSRSGVRRDPADTMFLERKMTRCRAMMPRSRFEGARSEGVALPLFAALAEAQAWLEQSGGEANLTGSRSPGPGRGDVPGPTAH